MAGVRHRDIHDNRRFRSSCPVGLRLLSPFARMFGKELAGVEIEGRLFHAFVPQGTKFEQALDRIISKYGGGVAKLKYESMEGKEIVAVMIGDRCMVKGEPDKVAKADFSAFGESASAMREIAVEHARSSRGGIHFFAGAGGIPIAAGRDGEVAFLNASEVEVGKDNRFFSVRQVDYDKDPKRLSELGDGSISVTDKARGAMAGGPSQEDLARSHGGVRSEKLMLPESKILVFDINSQQVSTLAEFASPETGFKAPQFVPTLIAPPPQSAFTNIGIVFQTPEADIRLPMDGSPSRIPYLFVKVFDGRLEDALNYKKDDGRYIPGWSTVPLKTEGGMLETETCGRFTFVSYDRLPAESPATAGASAKPAGDAAPAKTALRKQAAEPQKKSDRKRRRRKPAPRTANRLPGRATPSSELRQMVEDRSPAIQKVPMAKPSASPLAILPEIREAKERKQPAKTHKEKKSKPKQKSVKKDKPVPKARARPRPKSRSKKSFMASRKPAPEPLRKARKPIAKAKASKPISKPSESVRPKAEQKPRKAGTPPRPEARKKASVPKPSGTRKTIKPAARLLTGQKKRKSRKKRENHHLDELLAHWKRRGRKFRMKKASAV